MRTNPCWSSLQLIFKFTEACSVQSASRQPHEQLLLFIACKILLKDWNGSSHCSLKPVIFHQLIFRSNIFTLRCTYTFLQVPGAARSPDFCIEDLCYWLSRSRYFPSWNDERLANICDFQLCLDENFSTDSRSNNSQA